MVGFIGAAFSLAQFVVAPMLGRLSDRIGRKPVLVFSLVGTALASFGTGFSTVPWMLIATRAFDGASGATLGVAQAAVADIAPPRRRAALLGMLGAAFGIGFTIGPAIAGVAVLIGGRRAPFFVAGTLAAANAIATMIRFPDTKALAAKALVDQANQNLAVLSELVQPNNSAIGKPGPGKSEPNGANMPISGNLAKTWRQNELPALIVIGALTALAFSMFEQMFTLYGEDRIGFTKSTGPWAFVLIGLVVSIVQGGLVRKAIAAVGERRLLLAGTISVGVGLALVGVTRSWLLLVPTLLLLAAGQGFASPTMSATMTNAIDPEVRGELLGQVARWGALARVGGPILGGFLFGHVAKGAPFFVGAGLYVVAIFMLIRRRAATA